MGTRARPLWQLPTRLCHGTIIEMWYNSDKKTIETAYPKGHKNQYNKK